MESPLCFVSLIFLAGGARDFFIFSTGKRYQNRNVLEKTGP